MATKIPDFSLPSKDCFLTTDKNGVKLKVGDIIASHLYPFSGFKKINQKYKPVEKRNGKLIIPHYGSYLLDFFVQTECKVVSKKKK